ncbi:MULTISPECIES: FAD-dependent monooxygenase [unclassified Psychrobacter]|uniref:FAD-dependent monooxygenase n=1 Tax=unclassified Psychrobacter TaxID=196806 RepID=UPI00086B2977|nr:MULTISPECIES: FAD-dependent monooxygenase [unclassified Psychrobacter]MBA6245090.1 FAD-dependent monooxygenase [Psychrobacter sp. Urea-trap-18]MBA6286693.1 FAD-dependent monooxygenase [Psychrobacter sp. Urea-trap-16]MBA6317848.1 FAD-dependent monooxygenase [Psychrobacter sp. Urea-trap-20]MBA6334417.1 FAD-dependent monooxygenase [Psychrobacter sp. Urea-trap-19]OEH68439.1 MAG: 2-octaprenyl-3-methyl-6-methoxy-1,4-benzoquinol hydroxylase [Psychrobacter sp. B29-1]|tara:strand:+ start:28574 stop:29857 length:1284 start_codon:yes stop_codon:yes gene_type:complete
MKNNHTLIIGSGIVGATLALKLAQDKMPVTLIDARPERDESAWQDILSKRDARVYALSMASINLLKDISAWQHITVSKRKADYSQMQVWQLNGMGELLFGESEDSGAEDNSSKNYEPILLGSMVEPAVIEHALWQRLHEADVSDYLTLIAGHKVVNMDWLGVQQGYRVTLDNGEAIDACLLVGADGRGSFVRQQAGIGVDTLDYKQTAICCAIQTEKPHQATARQAMLPTGTLALLPLADITDVDKASPQHWQSIVWTLPRNQALALIEEEDRFIADKLAAASNYELGAINQIESIASFPLAAQQAKSYVADNLVLIGDAAHGVHPLAGQGLNLGMLDVQVLCEQLTHDFTRSGGTLWGSNQTLRHYERSRRPHNSLMMHSFSALNWLFAGSLAQMRPVQQIRNEGMYRVSKIKPLMRLFAKQASGV